MSEDKGPYRVFGVDSGTAVVDSRHELVDSFSVICIFKKFPEAETCAYAANVAFNAGRASRDGLARALNDILEGGNETSAWAFGVAKRAIEADGDGNRWLNHPG